MFTLGALHVTAAFVLGDDAALGTVFSMSSNGVGYFRVTSTFREPFPDYGIVWEGVINLTIVEIEDLIAPIALYLALGFYT